MEKELICNGCNKNSIVELWNSYLMDLNNKNTNFYKNKYILFSY